MALSRPVLATILAAALAACGDGEVPAAVDMEHDPALAAALDEQIMVDPDLTGLNQANQVVSLGPRNGIVPTIESGAKVLSLARAEALELVGGPAAMKTAPEPAEVSGAVPPEALGAAALAASSPGVSADCARQATFTARWAARMPDSFPVYPRGAVMEAAGTDAGTCALRSVGFVTPVPLKEVADFYYTRAIAAGYSAKQVRDGDEFVLGGAKGKASFVVYLRRLPTGNTGVDLVVSGA